MTSLTLKTIKVNISLQKFNMYTSFNQINSFSCFFWKRLYTRFFCKQHLHKQHQAEIGKKSSKMVSITLRLNIGFLKMIHILHPHYHPKIIGHTLKNKQKNKCVFIDEIIQLIIMKMKMKKKNRSHRYNINSNRPSHEHKFSKYKKCLSMMMLKCIK